VTARRTHTRTDGQTDTSTMAKTSAALHDVARNTTTELTLTT